MLSQANRVSVTSVIFMASSNSGTRGLADEHRLADDLAIDQGLLCLRGALQREAAPDAGLELALRGEIEQRLGVGGGDLGVGFVEPADAHPDCLNALDQEVVGAGQCRRAAE